MYPVKDMIGNKRLHATGSETWNIFLERTCRRIGRAKLPRPLRERISWSLASGFPERDGAIILIPESNDGHVRTYLMGPVGKPKMEKWIQIRSIQRKELQ